MPPKETYQLNDKEFNLARMEINTFKEARKRFPRLSIRVLSDLLGINERTFYRKINHYGLDIKDFIMVSKEKQST